MTLKKHFHSSLSATIASTVKTMEKYEKMEMHNYKVNADEFIK